MHRYDLTPSPDALDVHYFHVAVLEGYEECFVSGTEAGLRKQVADFLTSQHQPIPTDEEWDICTFKDPERFLPEEHPVLGAITYYKAIALENEPGPV